MLNYQITSVAGRHKSRKRVGRGTGSGYGKTCGRGHKGSKSRAGAKKMSLYEGGQMPLFRRLPKRGFNNARFASQYETVNVSQLEKFDDGGVVGTNELKNAGLIRSAASKVKILGDGQLTKKLEVKAHKFSRSAQQKIMATGGSADRV